MVSDAAFLHFPLLSTKRLQLRRLRFEDAEGLFPMFSDIEAMPSYGHEPHRSLDDTYELIRRTENFYTQRVAIRWGIVLAGEEKVIGTCGLHHLDLAMQHGEIGYELYRDYWRQGIMTEAASAVLNYGFDEMGLHRIEAVINKANVASRSLLEKLGFTYEGALRQRSYFQGEFRDERFFGLLKPEWRRTI